MTVLDIECDGVTYQINDPGDGGRIAKTLRDGNPVEPAVLDDMRSLGLSGRAVDVGGGVGNHTLWLAIACGFTVETFEPRLSGMVAANIALNGLDDRVTLHPVALGDEAGAGHWSNKQRGVLDPGTGDVEIRTLDSYGFEDVALVKIDVEGMEAAVLRGAVETLERCRPVVYSEAWEGDYLDHQRAILEPLGYTYGRRFNWHQHRWNPS